jgi:hypothetical protein
MLGFERLRSAETSFADGNASPGVQRLLAHLAIFREKQREKSAGNPADDFESGLSR